MKRSVHRFFGIALVAAALLGVSSCLDSTDDIVDPNIQLQKDIATIDNYMLTEGVFGYREDEYTKIRFVIKKLGTKLPARTTATKISADYKVFSIPPGTTPYDQGNITSTQLGTLISGWQTMAMKLPVGTIADLYIPSLWAYGTGGKGEIPGNMPLLFEDFEILNAEITSAEQNQFKSDTTAIRTYLEGKDYTDVVYDTTGIAYRVTTQGGGSQPSWFSKVTFKAQYKLLTDDTRAVTDVLELKPQENVTDSRPVDYIQGLMIGLQQLREGSKATFYIPSGLGFGVQGASNNAGTTVIPANSNIIVDIEVIAVSQ
jgi:FKBP-type peptidyl-prolyl cis-trans isomerase